MKKISKVYILTNQILKYFDEVIEGVYSDIAIYGLLEETEKYFDKLADKNYVEYLEFTFGINKKDFKKILKQYNKRLKDND